MLILMDGRYGSGMEEIADLLARQLSVSCLAADAPSEDVGAHTSCILTGLMIHPVPETQDALRVFIHGDLNARIERVMRDSILPRPDAERLVLMEDRQGALLYGQATGRKRMDMSQYDLCLNSSVLGVFACAEMIKQLAVHRLMARRTSSA